VSSTKKIVAVGHHDNLHTAANESDDLKRGMATKKLDFGK
jgi:hypothetical protein